MKYLSIILFLSCSPLAYGSDVKSVEELLKETESALDDEKETAPPVKASKEGKSKTVKKKHLPTQKTKKTGVFPRKQNPIDPSFKKLVEIKESLVEIEKTGIMSSYFSLGLGINQIDGSYQVEKDDDVFSVLGRNLLYGASVSYGFPVYTHSDETVWFANVDISYFNGQVEIRREGIENYDAKYSFHQVPADLSLVYARKIKGMVFSVGPGYGFELLRQEGEGQFDSISGNAQGHFLYLNLKYQTKQKQILGITYKNKNTNDSISGQSLVFSILFITEDSI